MQIQPEDTVLFTGHVRFGLGRVTFPQEPYSWAPSMEHKPGVRNDRNRKDG